MLVEVYTDVYSGKSGGRPSLHRLEKAVVAGEVRNLAERTGAAVVVVRHAARRRCHLCRHHTVLPVWPGSVI